ncbi:MAG: hypothetical protein WCI73_02785 [Phycisphaerae bacterium]
MERKLEKVEVSKLRPGPIQHSGFSDELLQLMRVVHDRIKDVYPISLEKWELGFMRDRHPERELAVWQLMSDATEAAAKQLPALGRKAIFKVVLGHSMGALTTAQLADPDTMKIVEICKGI